MGHNCRPKTKLGPSMSSFCALLITC
jgi:hypothetical protein